MADSGSEDERDTARISVKFKTTTETIPLEVGDKWAISRVKSSLSEKVNQPAEKICLIFSGKILKDHETLSQHKIGDGMVIHMVIRGAATPARPDSSTNATSALPSSRYVGTAPAPTPPSSTQPQQGGATQPSPANPMLGGAEQILNNPELLQEMMNSPLIQNVLGNPDVVQSLFANNPQFQEVVRNNPELGHILRDPDIMRQTMEMMRNPAMFNEMMRNHDQAIRNLQGIPGGEAALQRLYQDIQEPLTNSVVNQFAGNPYTGGDNSNSNNPNNTSTNPDSASRSQRAGVENAEALPNPWQGIAGGGRMAGANPSTTGGAGAAGGAHLGNLMNAPGIQSLFRQMTSNPAAMQSLVNPESMAQMARMMGQNPALMQQVMQSMGGAGGMADQLQGNMPNMMNAMMGNPQVMQAFSNPRVMQALQQIQQAFLVIRNEAPHLLNLFGGGAFENMFGAAPGNAPPNVPAALDNQAISGANALAGASGNEQDGQPPAANAPLPPVVLAQLMQQMMSLNNGANALPPPEERFRAQLEQLANMGFTNEAANIEALSATFGNLEAAIERLLGGGGGN